jgi:lipid II:glycine glycyltransferase (peptidoglycan interpeptide bridge formation enzyme)
MWFQTTKIPVVNKFAGYLPRVDLNEVDFEALYYAAKKVNCIYVTIDPINIKLKNQETKELKNSKFKIQKAKPVHLQNNVIINLEGTDEEILNRMKQKYRYNIRLATKKGIQTKFENSDEAFETFLKIYLDTKKRHNYFGRGESYLRKVWQKLGEFEKKDNKEYRQIVTTYYENKPLTSMFLFLYEDTVYYPYGGSSDEYRNFKPTYLQIYEVLKWAKNKGYKHFDFWGIEEEVGENDGFSSFKLGFGGDEVRYEDSIDLVISPVIYKLLMIAMWFREKLKFIKTKI